MLGYRTRLDKYLVFTETETMRFIDSHIHLDFKALDSRRFDLMASAEEAGVDRYIVPATMQPSWAVIDALQNTHREVSAAYGLHPYFIDSHRHEHLEELHDYLSMPNNAVAVGEIGLDFCLAELDRVKQRDFFKAQLMLAHQFTLPVILHVRKAVDDIIQCCREANIVGGIAHSYNGSLQQAKQLLAINIKLGFGGAITYSRAKRLHQLIRDLPLCALCIETDAPDQSVFRCI
jgi:TatD DNase family protein